MNAQAPITPDLLGVARRMVDDLERLRPAIEAAIIHTGGTHTFDDVVAMVLQGRVRMWATPQSFVIVERLVYPQQVHYHAFLAGGAMDEDLLYLENELVAAAAADGACKVTASGRRGWVRMLEGRGWRETTTAIERRID